METKQKTMLQLQAEIIRKDEFRKDLEKIITSQKRRINRLVKMNDEKTQEINRLKAYVHHLTKQEPFTREQLEGFRSETSPEQNAIIQAKLD